MPNCFSDLTYSGQWYEFYSTLIDAAAPGTPKLNRGCFEGLNEDLQKYQLNLALNEALANKASSELISLGNDSSNTSIAVGEGALEANINGQGNANTAIAAFALNANTLGSANTALGFSALSSNTTGSSNCAVGSYSLEQNTIGINNTAIGTSSLDLSISFVNTTGIGYLAQVTGSNQIQLGNSATTTYAYGAVQNRSDARDKTDIKDTELGLDFIKALRPVDFKWDMREDYRAKAPKAPEKDATAAEIAAYNQAKAQWIESCKLANITHDGSKKRTRYHHGLIAQEVKSVLESQGIDFGGFQDHSINGGDDVLSIGYNELIAPLIKSIQQLSARIEALEAQN